MSAGGLGGPRWGGTSPLYRHLSWGESHGCCSTPNHTQDTPPPAPQMSLVPQLRNPILEALPPSQYRSKGPLSRDVFWERARSPLPAVQVSGFGEDAGQVRGLFLTAPEACWLQLAPWFRFSAAQLR